ncbi:MAG: hypothetical protein EOM80_19030, partial [Erysipelotrichia bacterium]|nr:hypothetical protein [Erysipelotrichia bacterium]
TMKNPIISYFPGGIRNVTKQFRISIEKLHSGIVSCQDWIEPTEKTRDAYLKYGKSPEYKAIRNNLPYVTPDGVWSDRTKTGKLLKASNLIQVDIDGLDSATLQTTRQIMVSDSHTMLLFVSPSGAGLKAFVYCENFSLSRGELIRYYKQFGIVLDESTLHDKAAAFVCHDSRCFLNLNAEPFVLNETAPTLRKKVSSPIVLGACSTASESAAFCKSAIEKRAREVAEAPQHAGTTTLNRCAFCLGMFADAGLSKAAAEQALREAYLNRPYKKHTESEFIKSFNGGWEAGRSKPLTIDKPSQQAKAAK